jgi:hypothetical protein
MRWAGHVAHVVKRNAYEKTVRKEPLGRPRHGCENKIIMDPRETKLCAMDWLHLFGEGPCE